MPGYGRMILDKEPVERHTFVIKLWQEGEEDTQNWRGRITHVASGESAHFVDLQEILVFITRYLQGADYSPTLISKLRRWFYLRRPRR